MIGFSILAFVLIASAIWTITQRQPVYSVVGLLVNFVALAIMYLTLNAEFIFVIQLIVYSGAILVLFLFVIALLSSGVGPFSAGPNRLPHAFYPALALVLIGCGLMFYAFGHAGAGQIATPASSTPLGEVGQSGVFGSVADFGTALFSTYLLPFEVTALLLMVAVIGVVILAGDASPEQTRGHHRPRRRAREREPIVKAER